MQKTIAFEMLEEARDLNPGPWIEHSLRVAAVAKTIAEIIPRFDPERAYTMGLLHDIGRRS